MGMVMSSDSILHPVSARPHFFGDDPQKLKVRGWVVISVALFLLLSFVPAVSSTSYAFYMVMAIALASSFNYVAGLTGYMPFGYVAFYGLGSYTTGILVKTYDINIGVALISSGVIGLLAGLLLAPTLRLKSVYFGIVSLALAIVFKLSISLLPEEFAGGSMGIVLTSSSDPIPAYYCMLVLMLAALLIGSWLAHSRIGVALRAIRDDEEAAATMGVNVTRTRMWAWLAASIIPALAGGIEAWYSNAIDLESSFNLLITAKTIVYAMAGGLGFACGPLVGAVVLYVVDQLVWSYFPSLNLLFLGVIIMLMVIYFPRGIVGEFAFKYSKLRKYIP